MDTRSAQLELGHDASAPRAARRFVIAQLRDWGVEDEAIERSQLLVSELVSNAILHGTGPVVIVVTQKTPGQSVFRIEVCNGGEGAPTLRRAEKHELSGRGLQLVDELSRGWGSKISKGQTHVWFELDAAPAH
jgi:anti-sigma regulatory factor (Ser/Thr protein kinase)